MLTFKTEADRIVADAIRKTARDVLPPGSSVFLYGSRARGDATPESDWDLLILTDADSHSYENFTRYAAPFVDIGFAHGQYVSPQLYSRDEWERGKGHPFYENVTKEGVPM